MDAIRNSSNPNRTLESFWKGQIRSKQWLVEKLFSVAYTDTYPTIDIHGGWNGVLASMLFQSTYFTPKHIRSVDIDPSCEKIASDMNKLEKMAGKFLAVTDDMCKISINADIVINTSCEHITQHQYESWLSGIPSTSLIVLQSNNYNILKHIRIADTLEEFKIQCKLNTVLWEGELVLPLYTRYMIIGRNNVKH
jgi:hypothetical protein